MYYSAKPSATGEPVKRILACTLLLLVCFAAPTRALAQSNASPDYHHQHKSAQKYQKAIAKQRKKQAKAEAKAIKSYRKQHEVSH